MSAVEITISGVMFDKTSRTMQPVVIFGEASLTGLGVGGGPIIPPSGGGGEHPAFPIAGPGPFPPKPGYPNYPAHPIVPPGGYPHPEHPIALPPDTPTDPPPIDPTQPPSPAWSWCWNPNTGWIPAYVAEDKPHPIHPPGTTAPGSPTLPTPPAKPNK